MTIASFGVSDIDSIIVGPILLCGSCVGSTTWRKRGREDGSKRPGE